MIHRPHRDDPERIGSHAVPLDELPLFAPTPASASWPERPVVTGPEQAGLQLPESIEDRYATWRTTEDGITAYQWLEREALGLVARGAERLFIDRLAWEYRQTIRRPYNNDFRALMARELIEAHPNLLRGRFELRERRAS